MNNSIKFRTLPVCRLIDFLRTQSLYYSHAPIGPLKSLTVYYDIPSTYITLKGQENSPHIVIYRLRK